MIDVLMKGLDQVLIERFREESEGEGELSEGYESLKPLMVEILVIQKLIEFIKKARFN